MHDMYDAIGVVDAITAHVPVRIDSHYKAGREHLPCAVHGCVGVMAHSERSGPPVGRDSTIRHRVPPTLANTTLTLEQMGFFLNSAPLSRTLGDYG